jgi:hypothetical protein
MDGLVSQGTFEYRVVSEYGSLTPWVEAQPSLQRAIEVQAKRSEAGYESRVERREVSETISTPNLRTQTARETAHEAKMASAIVLRDDANWQLMRLPLLGGMLRKAN